MSGNLITLTCVIDSCIWVLSLKEIFSKSRLHKCLQGCNYHCTFYSIMSSMLNNCESFASWLCDTFLQLATTPVSRVNWQFPVNSSHARRPKSVCKLSCYLMVQYPFISSHVSSQLQHHCTLIINVHSRTSPSVTHWGFFQVLKAQLNDTCVHDSLAVITHLSNCWPSNGLASLFIRNAKSRPPLFYVHFVLSKEINLSTHLNCTLILAS